MTSDAQPWWETFYDEVHELFPIGVDDVATEQIDLVEALVDLRPGDRVLDLGCGAGRHSILMQERACDVTGVDLSEALLERARQTWKRRHGDTPGPRFVRADMRSLPDLGTFDLVVVLDMALGVFDDDAEHLRALISAASVLREDGHLVLELMNPYFWAHAQGVRYLPARATGGGADVVRTYRFDPVQGRVEDSIIAFVNGERRELPTQTLRTWTPAEIGTIVKAAGFRQVRIHGSERYRCPRTPRPLDARESAFMWVVARL